MFFAGFFTRPTQKLLLFWDFLYQIFMTNTTYLNYFSLTVILHRLIRRRFFVAFPDFLKLLDGLVSAQIKDLELSWMRGADVTGH